jgi:hypothetical protein
MRLIPLSALIGSLLTFGIVEIFFCKVLLDSIPKLLVVLIISAINFVIILFIIRRQPVQKQEERSQVGLATQEFENTI